MPTATRTNVDLAESAIRHFAGDGLDRYTAARLLAHWQPRSWMLDAADEVALLARFDRHPARGIR